MDLEKKRTYWKSNLTYLVCLCFLWFVFGLVCPVLIVDQLNTIRLGGIPLGFWFATQGATVLIITLLFLYNGLMNRLDKRYDVEERSPNEQMT